jgi:hypothetical protein
MVAGATNAALNGAGWQGVLMGAGIGGLLGGSLGSLALGGHQFAAGVIGGAIAVGGAVNAYQQSGWESVGDFAGGVIGGIGGGYVGYQVGTGLGNALKAPTPQQQQAKAQNALNTDQKPEVKGGSGDRGHYLRAENTNPETGIRSVDEIYVNDGNRQITVIGARQDTLVAKEWPNHNVLDLPRNEYFWQKNIGWLDEAISRNDVIYMATNPEQCTGTYGQTYLKEISYLESKGYVQESMLFLVENGKVPRISFS